MSTMTQRPRFTISTEGRVTRNGYTAFFEPGKHNEDTLHFVQDAAYQQLCSDQNQVICPDVYAQKVVGDFCWPSNGQCEYHHQPDGAVHLLTFHPSFEGVLTTIIFPSPTESLAGILYESFIAWTKEEWEYYLSRGHLATRTAEEQVLFLFNLVPEWLWQDAICSGIPAVEDSTNKALNLVELIRPGYTPHKPQPPISLLITAIRSLHSSWD